MLSPRFDLPGFRPGVGTDRAASGYCGLLDFIQRRRISWSLWRGLWEKKRRSTLHYTTFYNSAVLFDYILRGRPCKSCITHDIDDLGQGQTEGDVEGNGRIDGGTNPRVVVTHQVAHQLVLILISNDYNWKAEHWLQLKSRTMTARGRGTANAAFIEDEKAWKAEDRMD